MGGAFKRDIHAIYLAARDPRVSWYAKLLALFVAGYALSPIDLIPDFIPVLGYLDDLLIAPLGLALALKAIPAGVLADYRARAEAAARPVSYAAATVIVLIWIAAAVVTGWFAYGWFVR